MDILLVLADRLPRRLVLQSRVVRYLYKQAKTSETHFSQSSADSASLLLAEVKGLVLLRLVELPEVLSLLLVHHSHDPSNRLANGVATV